MTRILTTTFMVALATTGFAGEAGTQSERIGRKVETFTFMGRDGAVSAETVVGSKATVLAFVSFDCPVSNAAMPVLNKIQQTYGEKGVKIIAVNPGDVPQSAVEKAVKEFSPTFRIVRDPKAAVAKACGVETTPEVVVLDSNRVIRYAGRIDNSYSARLKKNSHPLETDLVKALDDLLAGREVKTPLTKAIGCPIIFDDAKPISTQLTYHKDVGPILQQHCAACHRPGQAGPFSLLTYKQAVNWADDIKTYTQSREMPPWKLAKVGPEYHNQRFLTDAELKVLAEWADGGTPEGDPKDALPPKEFVEGWQLGKPDLILSADEEFSLAATGPDLFRCFVLPTGLSEDQFVVGYEVRPGNPQVVHHTLNYWDATGKGAQLAAQSQKAAKPSDRDHGPGYSTGMGVGFIPLPKPGQEGPVFGGLGGWAPGQMPRKLPDGTGYFLPKGADVILQVHYHRDGRARQDKTKIGLYFAKKPIEKPYRSVTIGRSNFLMAIPANRTDYVIKESIWVNTDSTLHSIMPHMHLIGKSVKVSMTSPGSDTKVLLAIPDWDYNWQETYWLKEPISIKAGTRFDIEAIYDNSAGNPNNPNSPPKVVTFGEQTTNEMLFGFLGMTSDSKARISVGRSAPPDKK